MTHSPAAHQATRGRRFSWAGAIKRFGWRAYAVPILLVVTVVAIVEPETHGRAVAATQQLSSSTQRSAQVSPPSPSTTPTPTPTPTAAPVIVAAEVDSTVCASNTKAKRVVVSISQQAAWMCQGTTQVLSTPVTTGDVSAGDATPTGSWVVQGRDTDTYLTGPGYRDYVQFWIPFDGDIGFHDASWQTMPFGSPGYTTQGSHGCVHLPLPVVTWLYSWVKIGSTVVTVTT